MLFRKDESDSAHHSLYEDFIAMLTGTALVALGVLLFTNGNLATGGTAGIGFLLHYLTGLGFGVIFFAVNLPFYVLAVLRMGWKFTLRTFIAVSLVSAFSSLFPQWISLSALNPLFASALGGILMGVGMLVLFRHKASLGGVNILALFVQEKLGWRAGYVQMGIDVAILLASLFVLPLDRVAISVVGAVVLNLVIAMNHRPGRYTGFS